uniref:Uncharacterized protein n=1 Tax=Caenorhabditis japonica TaxID=281687 RepID=A0A8R1J2L8_CAEJA
MIAIANVSNKFKTLETLASRACHNPTRPRTPLNEAVLRMNPSYELGPGPIKDKIFLKHPKPFDSRRNCPMCGPGHTCVSCPAPYQSFSDFLEREQRCTICSSRHPGRKCSSDKLCIACNGRHNTAACSLKAFFSNPVNYPADAPKIEPFTFFRVSPGL